MQSAISPSSLSYPAYVHNVGLDTVADHKWMATGGITQNEIFDSNFIRLDYSLLYGLPDKVLEEVDTDGEDDEEDSGAKVLIKACSERNRKDVLAGLQASRRVESRGFWSGRRVSGSPGSGRSGDREELQELFNETLELMQAATRDLVAETPDKVDVADPQDVVPEDTGTKEALIKKVLDFMDQQESAERIDFNISLNVSNNMSLKFGAR